MPQKDTHKKITMTESNSVACHKTAKLTILKLFVVLIILFSILSVHFVLKMLYSICIEQVGDRKLLKPKEKPESSLEKK